jgi:hypothetical protein
MEQKSGLGEGEEAEDVYFCLFSFPFLCKCLNSAIGFYTIIDSTLAIFGEKEEEREGACLPWEASHPQI